MASDKSSAQKKKLITHLHWIWPAVGLGMQGSDLKKSLQTKYVLDGDSLVASDVWSPSSKQSFYDLEILGAF